MDCVNDWNDGKFGKVCDKEKLIVGEAIVELVQNPRINETIAVAAQKSGCRFLPLALECSSHCKRFPPRFRSIFSLFYRSTPSVGTFLVSGFQLKD